MASLQINDTRQIWRFSLWSNPSQPGENSKHQTVLIQVWLEKVNHRRGPDDVKPDRSDVKYEDVRWNGHQSAVCVCGRKPEEPKERQGCKQVAPHGTP